MQEYVRAEMEVVEFEAEDVITTSAVTCPVDLCPSYQYCEDELPLVPAG